MSSHQNRELGQLEDTSSNAPSFTFGDIIRMWVHMGERYATGQPEDHLDDPVLACVRRALVDEGYIHVDSEDTPEGDSHTSASSTGDRRLWDRVSPDSTFLSEHLPPTLPWPAQPGPSSSAPLSAHVLRERDAATHPAYVDASTGLVTRSVQTPGEIICPVHGPVPHNCPTHGLSAVVRMCPVGGPLELRVAPRDGGFSGTDADSIADTLSVINSFTMSLSGASSPTRSLYATPEHVPVPLPDVADAHTDADVLATGTAMPPAPVAPAPVAVVAAPAPVAVVAAPAPAPVAVVAAPAPAPVAVVAAPAPAPVAVVAAPAPAPVAVVAAPAPAPAPAPAGAHAPQAGLAGPPGPGANPPYTAFIAQDNGSDNYYVVTRGRTVGVFDNWAMMVASVSRISSGTGRGGFHTRESAIAAFRAAEAIGIVVQRDD